MGIFHLLATLYLISHAGAIVMKRPTVGDTPTDTDKGTFELLILHNNDMHARFEQTSQLSGTCTPADRDAGKCYGGFPRVAYVVKQARAAAAAGEGPPVLYLNAGDTYTGTAWFTIYKWKIAAEFINALQPDAVALGNHEFDAQTQEFSPFLRNINGNLLATNILFNSPEAKINLHRSIIFEIDGVKVGVVSYLTPDKTMLDIEGNIEYINEVLAVRFEANKLKNEGVNIVIALGHSESPIDIEIAKEIEEIDLVISATKNIFLWNGKTVNEELHEPVVVTQASGKMVPIISSTAYNKYLGQLVVTFDSNGEIVKYQNKPVLLDDTIQQDSDIVKILENHQKDMIQFDDEIVGVTSVVLDGASCRLEECNFGNLVTDAMVYYYALRFEGDNWTDAPIAVIPTGTIATSIAPSDRPSAITKNDLLQALPTESHLVAVELNGVQFLEMLEAAVADYGPTHAAANFLQFSGVRVVYDLERAPGSRVVSVVARCWSCFVPEYYTIDSWRTYKTLMPASLARSATGFAFLEDIPKDELAYDEVTCLTEYIGMRSPVYPDVAGRITILNAPAIEDEVVLEPESPVIETPSASSASFMSFTIQLITLAILGQIQYFI